MKKIYYIANIRIPSEKANGIQIMQMCQALVSLGYEVELVAPERKTSREDPFEYYDVNRSFKITKLWCLDWVKWGRFGFLVQLLTFTVSTIIFSISKSGLFYTRDEAVAALLRLFGKKVVWEVHMEHYNLFTKILSRLDIPIVTITKGLKNLYVYRGVAAERILVAHDAVNPKLFEQLPGKYELRKELGLPADKFIVSYIGKYKTMGLSKGVEDVVGPFADIQQRHPEGFLLLVGPGGEDLEELEKIFENNSIKRDSYKIQSHVAHKITPRYMKASDLLLILYPNTPHYAKYMSPLKLFEYMASNTPIVASDLPSIKEILDEEDAYFYKADDIESLTDVIDNAINDLKSLENRRVSNAQKIKEYTWEKRAKRILDFLKM